MVHCISTINLSQKLKDWLLEFAPDILYLQISNRESINFAFELIDYLKIPSVIHMMDDWPSTISSKGLFKRYWQRKIDREFRQLIGKIDLHLSISEAMSEAYQSRYHTSFKVFHNPVELKEFDNKLNVKKTGLSGFRILYLGRIGTANSQSIIQFARFISKYEPDGVKVEFDIYTNDIDTSYTRKLSNLHNVNVRPSIKHDEIPLLLMSYDLLLLPLDFTKLGLAFSRYSIPTKASEYMMSGTPVLVFAPAETAISRFFATNKCGHCLSTNKLIELKESLDLLIGDKEYRLRIGGRAILIAKQMFDARVVRNNFMSLLSTLHEIKSHSSTHLLSCWLMMFIIII
jgi:glycosyltransferase involved in cell wall biosynthesis